MNVCFGVPSNDTTEGLPEAGWTSPGTYTGKALITSLELSGSVGDNATVTVSMTGVGELEKA